MTANDPKRSSSSQCGERLVDNDITNLNTTILSRFGGQSRWFFAELIIIIAGVLIALAIDEWRGKIENANLELEYLHQLSNDLRNTEEKMAAAAVSNAALENATNQLVAAFEGSEPVELDMFRQWLFEISFVDNPVPVLGTAEALIFTGDLRLVRNPHTRSEITQYLSRSRDYWLVPLYQMEERHRHLRFQILSLAVKHGISPRHRHGLSQKSSEREAKIGTAEFFAHTQAYALASELDEITDSMSSFLESMSAEATKLRESLETQLSSD